MESLLLFFSPKKNAYLQLHWVFFCFNSAKIHPEKKTTTIDTT
jgi:hypothetical protein